MRQEILGSLQYATSRAGELRVPQHHIEERRTNEMSRLADARSTPRPVEVS
jgi:hypothetical protein